MNFNGRTNRLKQELAAQGICFDTDEGTNRLIQKLAAEKEAQIKRSQAVLKPLIFIAAIASLSYAFGDMTLGCCFRLE